MSEPHFTKAANARTASAIRRQFHGLERQVLTVICLTGLSRVVCLLLGGAMLCGVLDWLIHFNDPGLRLLAALSLAVGAGWILWRRLWSPLTERRSHSFLAALLERRRPYTGNQLTSAVEFLEHGLDPRLGSPLLQQAVIDQAEHRLAAIDLDSVINRREVRQQALAALGVCGAALLLIFLFPTEAATAVTRLLVPWGDTPWPRRVQLQLVQHDLVPWAADAHETRRVARGDTLELYVRNRKGLLPEDVVLEYRIGGDRLIREPMRKTILRDDQGHPVDVVGLNLPAARGPLFLRAVGGDDDLMTFFEIAVVSPPEVASLQIQLSPPAYSLRPAETLPAGAGDIQCLWGTRVSWTAMASQPLSEAALVFQGGGRQPMQIDPDGLTLSLELPLNEAKVTGYRFDLKNREGFHSGDRGPAYQVRITLDQVPQVTLEEPVANLTATSDAVLPLRIGVKDDLGLVAVSLLHQRDGETDFQERVLKTCENLPTDERLTESFALAPLELSPGDRLQFHIEARDAFDLGPPHAGHSTSRIVTIVGGDQKREELTDRLAELLADLSEGVAVQRRVADQTGELQTQLQQASKLRPEDADLLRKLDLEQQRVLHQLLEPGDSVRAQSDRLLEEFEANHLAGNETTDRLESLSETLSELGRELLPDLQRRLTQAQKQAVDAHRETAERLADDLSQLHAQQEETVRELTALEAELSGWRDRRHIEQQLSGLIDAQRGLSRTTRELMERLLNRNDGELTPQDRTEANKLSQRQRSEADGVEQFRKQLSETAKSLAEQDPETSSRLDALAHEMNQSGASEQLREAAASLAAGKIGQASQQQEDGLRALEELENLLENRPPDDQELLVKQLTSLEDDLETLHKSEELLARDAHAALNEPDGDVRTEALQQLAKRQDRLRNDLAEIERQLERLQARRPRDAARRAGEQMEQIADSLQDPEKLKEHLQESLDDLEQARRDLAQERRQAEEELALEQMLRLKDELQGLADRQAAVRDEILRLEEQRLARGSFTRGQLRTLIQAAETERELSALLQAFAAKLSSAEIVALTLRRIGDKLTDVARRLDEKQTDDAVQHALQAVQDQLARLLAVFSPDDKPAAKSEGNQPPEQPAEQQPAGPPGDVITLIAQLELLKDLQAECAARTAELEQRRDATGPLTPAQEAEWDSLHKDQLQLTSFARNLLGKLLERQAAEPEPEVESKQNESDQPPTE